MNYILVGKSGSGKDYTSKLLQNKGNRPIILYTTRPIRSNEKDGIDYHFVSEQEFINMIDNNELVSYNSYNTVFGIWYYGIKKEVLDYDYVIVLDIKDVDNFINYYGKENTKVVLIKCSDDIRMQRAMKRDKNFNEDEWYRRLKDDEIKFKKYEHIIDEVWENY